ncbi:MAG TPA: UDP-N-acetylglucosamine 2-epimerase [Pirellulales bacterium]|nr:UDP-N-acetylglucosamine 2-epimerase [Pirellulales bacterium]
MNHHLLAQWLEGVREQLQAARVWPLLDLEGVDAVDALLSPLFLAAMKQLRSGGHEGPRNVVGRLVESVRWEAYRVKRALAERRAAQRSAAVRHVDVLFWPRELAHYHGQGPVAKALAASGLTCAVMTCNHRAFDPLAERGVQAVHATHAWPEALAAARRDAGRRVQGLRQMRPERLPPFRQEGIECDLTSFYWHALADALPGGCESVANARAALARFEPRLLVVGNDITYEGRAGCLVARHQKVPSAVLHHGHSVGNALYGLHRADLIAVYSATERADLLAMGIDDGRVFVGGAPYLDDRQRQTGQVHPQLARLLGLRPGQAYVLVANSGPGHRVSHRQHELVIEQLMRLSNRFADVVFAVKLHRKDQMSYYRQAAERFGAHRLKIIPDGATEYPPDIFDWLQGCRAVLTGSSNVAVEAMLMDVPVISMDFCDEIHGIDFIDMGATLRVTSGEDLDDRLQAVLEGSIIVEPVKAKAAEYLHDSFSLLDGHAGERIAAALATLIGE